MEKRTERNKRTKNSKRTGVIVMSAIAAVIIIGTAAYIGYVYKVTKDWNNYIYPNVKIMGIDFSQKTKDEAVASLKEKYGDVIVKKTINIKYNDKTYTIDYSKLNARYNISEIADEAFKYGKDLNMFEKNNLIKNGALKEYKLTFAYDDKYVDEIIAQMEKDINKAPKDASIQMISSGTFKVTPDEKGYKLTTDKLKDMIKGKINGEIKGNVTLDAPVEVLTAEKSSDKLASINKIVATYTTNFSGSSSGRVTNITLATKAISGKVMMPGESFSFNDTVGERTKSKGYQEAGVIIDNKLDSGIGGGICQVSTTLYNSVLRANINATERTHHSLKSHYVGPGLDATVDWGNLDYKFTNTLNFPIFIEGYIKDNQLTFNIYSNDTLTNKTYTITNEVYETIPSTTKTIEDASIPDGVKKIEQYASDGFKVRVYRNTYENGNLVKQEVVSNDTYKAVQGIVRVGTKK